jgi:hypothetical protein
MIQVPKEDKFAFHTQCNVTEDGTKLFEQMGNEYFPGKDLDNVRDTTMNCKNLSSTIPAILHGRQDKWNPFHVMEVIIFTFWTGEC